MWPRVVEFMLGLWLAISPFLLQHDPDDRSLWISDFTCAAAVVLLACVSFWRPLRWAHIALLAPAVWLMLFGYFGGGVDAAPGYQNDIFIGLTLVMFAIIPNKSDVPPEDWRRHYQRIAEER
jgi:hypothetical protein